MARRTGREGCTRQGHRSAQGVAASCVWNMQQQREKHESQLGSRFTFLAPVAATQREMRLSFRVQSQSQSRSRNWDVAGVAVGAEAGAGQQQLLKRTPNTGSRREGKRREVKALPVGLSRAQWAEGYEKVEWECIWNVLCKLKNTLMATINRKYILNLH